jgi:hypothetical protein
VAAPKWREIARREVGDGAPARAHDVAGRILLGKSPSPLLRFLRISAIFESARKTLENI